MQPIPKVYILRTLRPEGAFGIMFDFAGIPFAVTLERTFEDGKTIIPPGIHDCHKTKYITGGYDTFEIEVPGHSRILFHKLNTENQSKGCIGIGEKFEDFNGTPGIAESKQGFEQFWQRYGKYDKIYLDIKEMELNNAIATSNSPNSPTS
jgi:hypothetical protein